MRSFADIVNNWLSQLDASNPEVSHLEGDEIYSVCLVPAANEFNRAYIIVDYVRRLTSLDKIAEIVGDVDYRTKLATALGKKADGSLYTEADVANIISQDLDNIAANYGVTRPQGGLAISVFRFFVNGNVRITLPDKSRVRTSGSTPLYYLTQGALTNETPQYDSATAKYYIDVGIESAENGFKYNVGEKIINIIDPPLTDILSGYNIVAARNGSDRMDDLGFIEYLKGVIQSREVGTSSGLRNLMINGGALDAYPIGPSSPYMTRADGGAVDVFVLTNPIRLSFVETFYWNSVSNGNKFYFQNQPVYSITGVKVNGLPLHPMYYQSYLVKDTESYAGSTLARDCWDMSAALAAMLITEGNKIEITYQYNYKIRQLQDLLSLEDNNVLESSNLVKEATEYLVDFTILPIAILPGYDQSTVKSNITLDLGVFFLGGEASTGEVYSGKKLGDKIDVSDLVSVVTAVKGVDRVDLTSLRITMNTQNYPTVDVFTVEEYAYARLGSINFVEQL